MPSTPFSRLLVTAGFTHAADQLAFAALPVVVLLGLGGSPALLSLLVAVQTSAWLYVAMPAGLWIDQTSKHKVVRLALFLVCLGLAMALLAALVGFAVLLAAGVALASAGTVIFVLAQIALTPLMAPADSLTTANSRIEFLRSLSMFAAPVLVGFAAERVSPYAGLGLALLMACAALVSGPALQRALPPEAVPSTERRAFGAAIADGAREILRQPLLRAIAACAIFWNFAYVALLAIFLPFALDILKFSPAEAGMAQGANGLGMIAGAFAAPFIFAKVQPRVVLLAGPGLSFAGAALIYFATIETGLATVAFGYFLMGMWSMLWLIMQTSIRQLVTPAAIMGRVTATIQTTIYGIRPLGALCAGAVVQFWGLRAAMIMVVASFALSFAVAALSRFSAVKRMPEPVAG